MALWILRNDAGEVAVSPNLTGFRRAGNIGDVRAARFADAAQVTVLPMPAQINGTGAAVRAAVEAMGAIYPADVTLTVVTADGEELARAQGVSATSRLIGVTRAEVYQSLIQVGRIDFDGCKAYIVHAT